MGSDRMSKYLHRQTDIIPCLNPPCSIMPNFRYETGMSPSLSLSLSALLWPCIIPACLLIKLEADLHLHFGP